MVSANKEAKMQVYKDVNGLTIDNSNVVPSDRGHFYIINLPEKSVALSFQQGPIPNHGVNGVTNESILAVLIHRTTILDEQFPSSFNKEAIEHMKKALQSFENRTKNRINRGVEGKNLL